MKTEESEKLKCIQVLQVSVKPCVCARVCECLSAWHQLPCRRFEDREPSWPWHITIMLTLHQTHLPNLPMLPINFTLAPWHSGQCSKSQQCWHMSYFEACKVPLHHATLSYVNVLCYIKWFEGIPINLSSNPRETRRNIWQPCVPCQWYITVIFMCPLWGGKSYCMWAAAQHSTL